MKRLMLVHGDCLKGVGVINPAHAVIDTSLTAKPGDIVHCRKDASSLNSYIKLVYNYGTTKDTYIVGTRYLDPTRDFSFVPTVVYGVVTEIFDGDGHLVYERKVS